MAPRQPKSTVPTTATSSVRVTRATAKRAARGSVSVPNLSEKKIKKPKRAGKGKPKEEPKEGREEKPKADSGSVGDGSKRTIVIEHCKQCNSFKTRANLVKEGLEKSVAGIVVILNPEKPRRGCFEIRQEGGEKFISLLDMKRPFTPMKQLDMDKVIADIVDKINNN